MVGEDGSYFGKGHLFFFLCNCFPDLAAVRVLTIPSKAKRLVHGKFCIYIMNKWFGNFAW